jgi:uncharacterized protein (TIGR02231 family)
MIINREPLLKGGVILVEVGQAAQAEIQTHVLAKEKPMKNKQFLTLGSLILCGWLLTGRMVQAQELATPTAGGNTPEAAASALAKESGTVKAASRIVQVTVYSDRALVTRRANLQLSAGEKRILFERLPGGLDENSVQVKGKGAGSIRGVNLTYVPAAGAEDEDARALVRKYRQLVDQLQAGQDTVAEAKKEREFIEAIAKRMTAASEKSDPGELNPQKWIDMVTFYRRRLSALDQEIRSETAKQVPLQEEQQKAAEEIQALKRGVGAGKYRAEVVADLDEPGALTLEITYVVLGPSWNPHYDLRADSKQAKLQAVYQGMVSQSTGEDWNDVELTLSTAQPRAGAQHPELQPWRLDTYREPPTVYSAPKQTMKRAQASAAAAPVAAYKARPTDEEEAPAPEMSVVQAAVENQASAVVFAAGGRQTVRSNNQSHRITVAVLDFPATFRYSVVPKLVASAFLQAKIKNSSNYPLLAGPTSIFLDNTFVANGGLNAIAPGEEFEAFLGVDEGIKVEHKLIKRQEQKEGVFGGRVKWLYEYSIKLTSHKPQTYAVVVKDQFPISGNGEIQVEMLEPVVKDNDEKLKKDNLNQLEWNLRLAPDQVVEIPLKFTVSYPKEMKVQGL